MPLEKPAYRDNLEQMLKFTGDGHKMTYRQVADYLKYSDVRTVKSKLGHLFKNGIVTVETLARYLS